MRMIEKILPKPKRDDPIALLVYEYARFQNLWIKMNGSDKEPTLNDFMAWLRDDGY